MTTITITPDGPFSLAAAAGFGFGPNTGRPVYNDGRMNLAFVADDFEHHAFVALRQLPNRDVIAEIESDAGIDAVERQVRRILSLDQSGTAWGEVGKSDPVVGRLQKAHEGLRPVLFHSPYEAAAWSVISARKQRAQGTVIRNRISSQFGATRDVAGETMRAFPMPEQLLELQEVQSLDQVRVDRLHAVARAALDGQLDPGLLLSMSSEEAMVHLQKLPGIGPTYGTLILLRATGATDLMTGMEPRIASYVARFYGLDTDQASDAELERISGGWRPFRTWTSVLCRVAGDAAGIPFPNTFARRR